jgi:hypothetical protein
MTVPIANVLKCLAASQLLKNTTGQMFELLIFCFGCVKSDDRSKIEKISYFIIQIF